MLANETKRDFIAALNTVIHRVLTVVDKDNCGGVMKIPILLSAILSVMMFEAGNTPFYVGVWKVDEAKTLQSLYTTKGINAAERLQLRETALSSQVFVAREDTFATYSQQRMPERLTFTPYTVARISQDSIETSYFAPSQRRDIRHTLTFEGDCYYVRVTKWQVKQYYCKVQ